MTVLKAISIAGGFAKFGSPDRVKILRTVPGKVGYENIKVDIKSAVKGEVGKDIGLQSGDIITVLEGIL
jgi:polysaccharide export outer membrane protein